MNLNITIQAFRQPLFHTDLLFQAGLTYSHLIGEYMQHLPPSWQMPLHQAPLTDLNSMGNEVSLDYEVKATTAPKESRRSRAQCFDILSLTNVFHSVFMSWREDYLGCFGRFEIGVLRTGVRSSGLYRTPQGS